jgi:FkbM family methyltransferase
MLSLSLLPRYIISLGIFSGLKTFIRVEVTGRGKIYLRDYRFPFYLRYGTTDRNVFREVFLFKEYNFKVDGEPSTIIDAGANIGLASIFFKTRFPKANIYAIEPDTANFKTLIQNLKPYNDIKAIQSAVWSSDAYLKIKNKNENAWAFEVQESTAKEPDSFPAISIKTLMEQNAIERIDLLKLDIEGSEKEVFSSNYEYWLPRTKVIIIELHDWIKEGCSRSFFKTIANYRFKVSVYGGMLLLSNLDLD